MWLYIYIYIFKSLLYYTDKTTTWWGGKIYINGWQRPPNFQGSKSLLVLITNGCSDIFKIRKGKGNK